MTRSLHESTRQVRDILRSEQRACGEPKVSLSGFPGAVEVQDHLASNPVRKVDSVQVCRSVLEAWKVISHRQHHFVRISLVLYFRGYAEFHVLQGNCKDGVSNGAARSLERRDCHLTDDGWLAPKRTKLHENCSTLSQSWLQLWLDQCLESVDDFGTLRNTAEAIRQAPPQPESVVDNRSTTAGQTARSASPYDPAVRTIYRRYMVFVERNDLPPGLLAEAKQIVTTPRPDEMSYDQVRKVINSALMEQEGSETEIVDKVFNGIIPQLKQESKDLSLSRDVPWTAAVPLPDTILSAMAPALSTPKPDALFGLPEDQFTTLQLAAIQSFTRDDGSSYVVPDRSLHLPFLSLDFKAQAKRNTRYIANNQAAVAGAIMNQGYQELSVRGGRDLVADQQPRFFSITADHELATVNLHWVGRNKDGWSTYNMKTVTRHLMQEEEGVRGLYRAVQNLLDYGRTNHLAWVRELLDVCVMALQSGHSSLHPSKRPRLYKEVRSCSLGQVKMVCSVGYILPKIYY